MNFNVLFETVNARNSFASTVGLATQDSTSITVNANLFTYAMRYPDAEVTHDGSPIKLIVETAELSSCPQHNVVSTEGSYSVIETADPIGVYNACSGNIDCADAEIKLLSQLSGSTISTPNDWARCRLSNRFMPYKDFKTFDINTTNKPVVFIVDSGINSHAELQDVEIVNFGKLSYSSYTDNLGHGTAIASCIAGRNVGITQNVSLYNYKVIDDNTKPTLLELGNVLDEIKQFKQNNPSLNVTINISWTTPRSPYLINKFLDVISAGCVVVCAAGNGADDVSNYTPAGMPEVITVGAIDDNDIIAGFTATSTGDASATSPYGQSLDIFAPGVDVDVAAISGNYKRVSGTSFAAPYVTAAAALIQSISTSPPSNAQVLNLISATSLKGSVLFNRENFSSNQNKIVQIINGDVTENKQYYLGALSGSQDSLLVRSAVYGFSYVSNLSLISPNAAPNLSYTLVWNDSAQQQKYAEYVTFNTETGETTINIPTSLLSEGVEFEKVNITVSKITDYSTQTCDAFFFITGGEEVPASVANELRFNDHVDVSAMSSGLLLGFTNRGGKP
jgi:subtilisin family serine protease